MDQSTIQESRYQFSKKKEVIEEEQQKKLSIKDFKEKFNIKKIQQFIPSSNKEAEKKNPSQELVKNFGITFTSEEMKSINFSLSKYYERYEEKEILGEGCIGLVKQIVRKEDQQNFAVKIVKTSEEEIIKNMFIEFVNLKKLNHANIVKVLEIYFEWSDGFQAAGTMHVVMEKIKGKELFDVITAMGHFTEENAKKIFEQILKAISYLHDNYVCHRDLKPSNILCDEENCQIKITDFNVSKFAQTYKEFKGISQHGKIEMWTNTGTVAYSAPEILMGGSYNEQVDMWSAGCILYTMLSGQLPFHAEWLAELIEMITKGEYTFEDPVWKEISEEAKDLIQKLLLVDSKKRITAQESLMHNWISDTQRVRQKKLSLEYLKQNYSRLKTQITTTSQRKMKKMRQLCYLFGGAEIWKRHTVEVEQYDPTLIEEEFRKWKSFDLTVINKQQMDIQEKEKNVFEIDAPDFFESDDDQ